MECQSHATLHIRLREGNLQTNQAMHDILKEERSLQIIAKYVSENQDLTGRIWSAPFQTEINDGHKKLPLEKSSSAAPNVIPDVIPAVNVIPDLTQKGNPGYENSAQRRPRFSVSLQQNRPTSIVLSAE